MKRHLLQWGAAALMVTMLSACGGGSDSSTSSSSISGLASKGPIKNGTVKVYALASDGTQGTVPLGTTTTSPVDGTYSVDIGSYSGNVIVEVTGGTYIDEATSAIKDNIKLRAALTGATGNVTMAVTPLTELAVKKAGTLETSSIEAANTVVSTLAGVNIVSTIPADVSTAPGSTVDDTTYGLMLATISQMASDTGKSVEQIIDSLNNDFTDNSNDGILNTEATKIKTGLQNFLLNTNNKSGVTDLTQTKLDSSIDFITTTPVNTSGNTSDINKAKALITDLRNTVLAAYNYQGVGGSGMLETPFNRLSAEMTTDIQPMLVTSADRLLWIIQAGAQLLDVGFYANNDLAGNTLTLTQNASTNTVTFVVKDPSNITLDTGSLTLNDLTSNTPTSGTLTGTIKTPAGNATVALNYTGTFNSGIASSVTFTGSIDSPELSIDFSQAGRQMSATFAPDPGNQTGDTDTYPTSINVSARITSKTARFDGSLSIPTIVWAENQSNRFDWNGTPYCTAGSEPKSGVFTGTFAELNNGAETGAKFTGTINANFYNAATFNGCATTGTSNFRQWDASFDGKIETPNRPTITAFLKGAEKTHGVLDIDASYLRTNTDNTVVYLTGSGKNYDAAGDGYLDLTNQDGLQLKIDFNDKLPCVGKFTGSIKTSGGTDLATLSNKSNPSCTPFVTYTDNYFESIF